MVNSFTLSSIKESSVNLVTRLSIGPWCALFDALISYKETVHAALRGFALYRGKVVCFYLNQ